MAEYVYVTTGINVYPAGPGLGAAVLKPSSADAYGSWTQIVESTSSDVYIVGARIYNNSNSFNSYIQLIIGTGSAGSEISRAVLNFPAVLVESSVHYVRGHYIPLTPFLRIPSGTRIACRVAGSSSNNDSIRVVLHYVPVEEVQNPTLDEVTSPDGAVVTDAGNSATSFKTDLTQTADDFWKDTFVKFKTGNLTNQVRRVLAYNGTTKFITCDAFTSAPAAGDTFDIINR